MGGVWAGSFYLLAYIKIISMESGKVINEKILETHNNPMSAAWRAGSSDNSMPTDMGKIVSAYLCTVVPSKYEKGNKEGYLSEAIMLISPEIIPDLIYKMPVLIHTSNPFKNWK